MARKTQKKNTKKNNSKKTKNKTITKNKESLFLLEIISLAVFAISILMFLSLFGIGAALGEILKQLQLGFFGILGYVFPFVFLVSYLIYIANKDNKIIKIKIYLSILIYILFAAFLQVFSHQKLMGFSSILEAYTNYNYGGMLGTFILYYISKFVGKIAATIIILLIMISSYLFIANLSFISIINSISFFFYYKTKENLNSIFSQKKDEYYEYEDYEDYENEDETYTEEKYANIEKNNNYNELEFNSKKKVFRGISIFNPVDVETRIENHKKRQKITTEKEINELDSNKINNKSSKKLDKKDKSNSKNNAKQNKQNMPFIEFDDKLTTNYENIEYKTKNNEFSTPVDTKIINQEDIFSGSILNFSKHSNFEENLDESTLNKADTILSKRNEDEIFEEKESINEVKNSINVEEASDINNSLTYDEILDTNSNYDDFAIDNIEIKAENIKAENAKEKQEKFSQENNYLDKENPVSNIEKQDIEKIITASGKVIEKNSESIFKETEEKDIKKYENSLIKKEPKKEIPYIFPPASLLKEVVVKNKVSDEEYKQVAIKLQQTFHNFGVNVRVTNISCGPVVTRYELSPEQGVKVSKIVALQDDIKLSLAANDIRIEAPIPGKSAVGIEVPNKENNLVYFRELIESKDFKENKYKLNFALGKDISGQIVVTDIAKMPHLLIAGATGSGKSVCINTLIMSILYKYSPDDVKLIMVDPKVVELSIYNGIPHLLIPVVTEPKKASAALNWAVAEMTDRYKKFAKEGVRDLQGYNEKVEKMISQGKDIEKLPKIIIIIDELADLMMVAQNEVEEAICRLAQLARACGIHLVIATQRPSVNVITGLIKANVPSRIAFAVSSGVDSRTILDTVGADKLLGKGDMLFSPQGSPKPMRLQGAFIDDNEVINVVEFIKSQGYSENYDLSTLEKIENNSSGNNSISGSEVDDLFMPAARFIIDKEKASIGNLQRVFKIGFNRAARIMDQLCEAKIVGSEQGTKPREILMDMETFEKTYGEN